MNRDASPMSASYKAADYQLRYVVILEVKRRLTESGQKTMKVNSTSISHYDAKTNRKLTEKLNSEMPRYATVYSQVPGQTVSPCSKRQRKNAKHAKYSDSIEVQNANRFSPMSDTSRIQ